MKSAEQQPSPSYRRRSSALAALAAAAVFAATAAASVAPPPSPMPAKWRTPTAEGVATVEGVRNYCRRWHVRFQSTHKVGWIISCQPLPKGKAA